MREVQPAPLSAVSTSPTTATSVSPIIPPVIPQIVSSDPSMCEPSPVLWASSARAAQRAVMAPGTGISMPVLAPAGSTSFVHPISLGTPLVAPIPPPGQMPMAEHLLSLGSVMPNGVAPASPSFGALTGALSQILEFDGHRPYAGLLYHSPHTVLHEGELVPDGACTCSRRASPSIVGQTLRAVSGSASVSRRSWRLVEN
jgi:hypothetical protein